MDLGKARVRSSEIVNDLELLSLEFVYLLIDICIPLRFQNALLRLHDGSNCWSFRNYQLGFRNGGFQSCLQQLVFRRKLEALVSEDMIPSVIYVVCLLTDHTSDQLDGWAMVSIVLLFHSLLVPLVHQVIERVSEILVYSLSLVVGAIWMLQWTGLTEPHSVRNFIRLLEHVGQRSCKIHHWPCNSRQWGLHWRAWWHLLKELLSQSCRVHTRLHEIRIRVRIRIHVEVEWRSRGRCLRKVETVVHVILAHPHRVLGKRSLVPRHSHLVVIVHWLWLEHGDWHHILNEVEPWVVILAWTIHKVLSWVHLVHHMVSHPWQWNSYVHQIHAVVTVHHMIDLVHLAIGCSLCYHLTEHHPHWIRRHPSILQLLGLPLSLEELITLNWPSIFVELLLLESLIHSWGILIHLFLYYLSRE